MTTMEQLGKADDPRHTHDDPLLDGLLILSRLHGRTIGRAGLAAGLNCLVTVSEYTRGQEFSGAAAVLGDLADLSLSRALQLTAKAAGAPACASA